MNSRSHVIAQCMLVFATLALAGVSGCTDPSMGSRDASMVDTARDNGGRDSGVSDVQTEGGQAHDAGARDAGRDARDAADAPSDSGGAALAWSECLDSCDHVTESRCREVLVQGDPGYDECFRGECFRANATVGPCGDSSDPYCCNAFQVLDTPDLTEFTVALRMKFNVLPAASHGGCKVLRFHSGDGADYGMTAAPLVMHPGPPERQFYWSPVNKGTLTVTDAVTEVVTNNGYCSHVSGKTYDCTYPNSRLKFATNMNFEPNKWRKLTTYVRWPSAVGANDGKLEFWIDDVLIFSLTDVEDEQSGGQTFRKLRVLPISEGTVPFYQYWDEIEIYEGYVPPGT